MTPKRRLSRKDPAYYVPLPYAMAIKKVIPEEEFEVFLFKGMKLEFKLEGIINTTIAVIANYNNEAHVIGYIPNGMISRIEGLMLHDDKLVVSLERKSCDRLKNTFWICIDELPDLTDFGLAF